jgi:uncharacterized repeat protein (TIGR01451 family)
VTCTVDGFGNVLNDNDGHSVNLFQPSITIDKTGDTLSKVGDDVDYTITVTDTSSGDTPDLSCTLTDALLGIDKDFSLSGDSNVTNATYTVQAGDPDPLLNTAYVTCTVDGFGNVLNDNDGHSVNLFQPSVSVLKTCEPTSAFVGDVITYTCSIDNTSSLDSPNLILDSVSDSLAGDQTAAAAAEGCDVLTSDPSETCSFQYTRAILASDPNPLVNIVTVHYHPLGFPNDITNSASCTVEIKTGCALSPGFWGGGAGTSKWDEIGDPVGDAAGFYTFTVFPWLHSSLAGKTYLEVLQLSAQGDVTRQLSFKYIAAKLNEAAFGVSPSVHDLLLEIEDYFDTDGVDNADSNLTDLWSQPVGSKPTGAAKTEGQRLFGLINTYFSTVGEEGCPLPSAIPEKPH